jgi:type IV secretion system protein VirB10
MKSNAFKKHKKVKEKGLGQVPEDVNDENEEEYDVEIDAGDPGVASAKGSKMMIIFASAVLITVVIYFLFFKGEKAPVTENLEEVTNENTTDNPSVAQSLAPAESIEDLIDTSDPDNQIFDKPKLPEVPKLPDIPKDVSFNESVLPAFLESPRKKQPQPDIENQPQALAAGPVNQVQNNNQQQQQLQASEPEVPTDPRRSPIVVQSSGGGSFPISTKDNFGGGIVVLNEDPINALKKTESKIVPTVVKDRTVTITQGKMMSAILETAINTEIPGSIRGIISRDVYAESGSNVLIPKGSRLYGNYSTQVVRGQGRVEINWTRLIRPDGVDMSIGFVAADQFGRSGIEGDVDNKYGSIITNSVLTSILAVGGAIAAEKLSGDSGATTTTADPQTGTTTSTGSASSKVIYDVSKTVIDTVGQVLGNTIDVRPIIRIPQGTRITIIVNDDMTIPPLRKDRKN